MAQPCKQTRSWRERSVSRACAYAQRLVSPPGVDRIFRISSVDKPCGFRAAVRQSVALQHDTKADFELADISDLATNGVAAPMTGADTRTVSSVVFEQTPMGRQPVDRACVGWEPFGPSSGIVAETIADGGGRYLLCGLPEEPIAGLFATMHGYDVTSLSAGRGGSIVLDIEIRLCATAPIEPAKEKDARRE